MDSAFTAEMQVDRPCRACGRSPTVAHVRQDDGETAHYGCPYCGLVWEDAPPSAAESVAQRVRPRLVHSGTPALTRVTQGARPRLVLVGGGEDRG